MPTLVDSSVWIDYFNGVISPHTDLLDHLLTSELVTVGDVILAEVLQGFRDQDEYRRARRALLRLRVVPMAGRDLALDAADNFRRLRRKGITVRTTIDCWIATFCMREGYRLLHNDRDFGHFAEHLGLVTVEAG